VSLLTDSSHVVWQRGPCQRQTGNHRRSCWADKLDWEHGTSRSRRLAEQSLLWFDVWSCIAMLQQHRLRSSNQLNSILSLRVWLFISLSTFNKISCISCLSADKVETAYESLRQKTTDVYIQRARQLYTVAPQRTSLFHWSLDDVCITVLADPSLHGYDNVVRVMREIDSCRSADLYCSATVWQFLRIVLLIAVFLFCKYLLIRMFRGIIE